MMLAAATCARLPALALASLAALRRSEGIMVVVEGDLAWVFWELGDERVLRTVLPVEGVELFEKRGDAWHRAGRRLPSSEAFPSVEPVPLARAVTPEPFSSESPRASNPLPLPIRLVKSLRPRPTTASLCLLGELGRWADSAPTREIETLRGVIRGDRALVLGSSLPPWQGSSRYWGGRLLVPIGYEVRPRLPESTLVEGLGDPTRELLRLVPGDPVDGPDLAVEAIPLEVFRPLTRAGVRLALVGVSTR